MDLTETELKKIIANRDPRYDGRFYFGVKTTGIYCRPICPAKPKPENIVIFKSHAQALTNGYRACKRCRPELAPGQKRIDEKYLLVGRALDLFESDELELNIDLVAKKLNMSSRHLRRLFQETLGAPPLVVLNSNRLLLAKMFLLKTKRPVTEVAFSVGFNSLRRFNEAFKEFYGQSPSYLRKNGNKRGRVNEGIRLEVSTLPPYDWAYVLNYLKKHLTYGTEQVEGNLYRRFIYDDLTDSIGSVEIVYKEDKDVLALTFANLSLKAIKKSLPKLKRLLDVQHNPAHLPNPEYQDYGARVPACFDPFETAISIIMGQMVSTKQAQRKLASLVKRFGVIITNKGIKKQDVVIFPRPIDLIEAPVEEIGVTKSKGEAIRSLAKYFHDNGEGFSILDWGKIREDLIQIRGIGLWTVEMIAMRCLGDVNAFPKSDLIVKRALEQGLVNEEHWRGFRSYLCHFIWHKFGEELTK